jgi:hypothetical protein
MSKKNRLAASPLRLPFVHIAPNPRDETRCAGWEVAKIQVFDPPTNKTSILGTLSENHGGHPQSMVACQRRVRTLRVKRGHRVQRTMEGANSFLF